MRVAIAMALYRPDPVYLAAQLRSIAAQSYGNWVCVITADSPLSPLEADREVRPFFRDGRFRWEENPDRLGYPGNFERAFAIAVESGAEAIASADQDDVWYPNKIETLVEHLRAAPPLSLVHSDLDVSRADGRTTTLWQMERRSVDDLSVVDLLVRNVVTGCAMMIHAQLVRRYPHISPAFGYHDHWYAALAAMHGGVHPIHRPLGEYRQHDANIVGARSYVPSSPLSALNRLPSEASSLRALYSAVRKRAAALEMAGAPITSDVVRLLLSDVDWGLGLARRAVSRLAASPALGRALLKMALGKLLTVADGPLRRGAGSRS